MCEEPEAVIGRYVYINYEDPEAAFRPYDPRFPEVARRVAALIEARMPEARVEHIGSTAVPGCAGKGVVDMMLLYPSGCLAAAWDAVDGLGFQRQRSRPNAFTEDRPVRVGVIEHDGEQFGIHVHIIAADAPEVSTQRRFRDRLRADPALRDAYVASKQAVLATGISDPDAYNRGKEHIIQAVLSDVAADEEQPASSFT